ncbi:unnamed protein product [Camellia sinensis]
MDHWTIFLILCLASTRLGTTTSLTSNVINYGAVGDGKTDESQTSAVELSDISYSGIMGTSTADEAINLSCSQSGGGCTDISLDRVYIASTIPGKKTYANCFNAHGRSTHTKPTVKCLMQ